MNKIYLDKRLWLRLPLVVGVAAALGLSWLAMGETAVTPPNIQKVGLSSEPLYSASSGDKPTMVLNIGTDSSGLYRQYKTDYSNATEYLGYWDADSCYRYDLGDGTADNKRFVRSGLAETAAPAQRTCQDAFSGNFLNFAALMSVDALRLALTGGQRYLDTATMTVLQRATIPAGLEPSARLNRDGLPGKPYFGAIPQSMIQSRYLQESATDIGGLEGNDLVVRNISNRLIFTAAHDWEWYGFRSSSRYVGETQKIVNETGISGGDEFLYARVEVCEKGAGGALADNRPWALCSKQVGGNYKPVGTLQKYSNKMRIAVMSYLTGPTVRYGGVLRSPMKYLGNKTFDPIGTDNTPSTGNPASEWDPITGVLTTNPDNDQMFGVSGAINFINGFERNGIYAPYDPEGYLIGAPSGELHLEALRYLQGQAPTPSAIAELNGNLNNTLYGGFPAYTAWMDPYTGRDPSADYICHRANVFAIGESWSQDSGSIPSPDPEMDMPNIAAWKAVVNRFEKGQAGTYLDSSGLQREIRGNSMLNPTLETSSGNFSDGSSSQSNTRRKFQIYGSAYWARTHDIRDLAWSDQSDRSKEWRGLRVKTLAFDLGGVLTQNGYEAGWSHPDAFHNNPLWMAAKCGGFETDAGNTDSSPYNVWGNPFLQSTDGTSSDVGLSNSTVLGPLWDQIWAGDRPAQTYRGQVILAMPKTYYRAGEDLRALFVSFNAIFDQASTSESSVAGSAVTSTSLTQAGTTIFRGSFNTSDWSGDLAAYKVTVDDSNVSTVSDTATWSAAEKLNALTNDEVSSDRNIVVGDSGANGRQVAVPFKWSDVSNTLKAALNKASFASVSDGLGEQRLNYLRGDTSNYGNFGTRTQRMGDVINSGAVYSGAPSSEISASSSYTDFYNDNKNRTPMVAVGANDGMLHAFNASDGKELFAYIPSWVANNLSELTNPDYVDSHRSYVDGTPAVGEAELASGWATVLVSGTGAGGRAVFALDVTDPTEFSASKVLWEFTNADDPDLGNVVGKPQILKMRTSAASASTATYKWFAVVGNGVNSYVADASGRFSTTGKPVLFFLDLSKDADEDWSEGENYYKVSFPVATGTALSKSSAAGIINFTAVLDTTNAVKHIYTGDLQGKLWKLSFASYGASDWTLAKLSAFKSGTASDGDPIPMYIANDAQGNIQPISAAPTLSAGAATGTRYVMFGTGKYLESADKLSTAVQTTYNLYDDGSTDTDGAGGESAITSRAYLQAGDVDEDGNVTVGAFTAGRATSTTSQVKSGWYFDLPTAGERQVNGGSVVGSKLVFSTLTPALNATRANCDTSTASGTQYFVEVMTGDATSSVSTVGILGELLLLEMIGETQYTAKDNIGRKIKTILTKVIQQGSGGLSDSTLGGSATDPNCPPDTPAGIICNRVIAGRLSWRQIDNYQEVRPAPW